MSRNKLIAISILVRLADCCCSGGAFIGCIFGAMAVLPVEIVSELSLDFPLGMNLHNRSEDLNGAFLGASLGAGFLIIGGFLGVVGLLVRAGIFLY